ncbi:DUF3223 domain-containing protein [Enterococcus sp. DIV1271a]|nr:DUF3223 domain-containing protein [Enterococcus sp. DIV1271a]
MLRSCSICWQRYDKIHLNNGSRFSLDDHSDRNRQSCFVIYRKKVSEDEFSYDQNKATLRFPEDLVLLTSSNR